MLQRIWIPGNQDGKGCTENLTNCARIVQGRPRHPGRETICGHRGPDIGGPGEAADGAVKRYTTLYQLFCVVLRAVVFTLADPGGVAWTCM